MTSIVRLSSQEVSGSESDNQSDNPSVSEIYSQYTPEVTVAGQGPNNIVEGLLYSIPSTADTIFLNSPEFLDLFQRTCSSSTESTIYLRELVARSNLFKSITQKDLTNSRPHSRM